MLKIQKLYSPDNNIICYLETAKAALVYYLSFSLYINADGVAPPTTSLLLN